jgi:hypothetical protein
MPLWHEFLASLSFELLDNEVGVLDAFKDTTINHFIYTCAMPVSAIFLDFRRPLTGLQGYTIELSESVDNSVLTPLTAATNTWTMTMATPSKIYALYASHIAQLRSLEAWHPTPVKKAVTLGRRGIRNSFSTASWTKPCGQSCPVRWRHVRGLAGVGVFHWGGYANQHPDEESGVGEAYSDTDKTWVLGDICTNENCLWTNATYQDLIALP